MWFYHPCLYYPLLTDKVKVNRSRDRLSMMQKLVGTLELREREQLAVINDIATGLFDDELVTWSRVVTLHAFCGYLARHCEERGGPEFVDAADDVARILGGIIVDRLGLWIVANGGWVSAGD
jgi:hypothetical protein